MANPVPAPRHSSWRALERDISSCERCVRLREHCREVASVKRRAFRDETYWGRPVPGFGDPGARILLVGLAPAAHGANRTGRVFTGDRSGEWLYGALHRLGLASRAESVSRDDGLHLRDAYITAACRCAPPGNRPTPAELAACAPYLDREFDLLHGLRVVVVQVLAKSINKTIVKYSILALLIKYVLVTLVLISACASAQELTLKQVKEREELARIALEEVRLAPQNKARSPGWA